MTTQAVAPTPNPLVTAISPPANHADPQKRYNSGRALVQLCDPADAMIAYPVACAAGRRSSPAEALLGQGRSRVLQQTGAEISTTDLSRQLQLAPSTVSHHLAVLLGSGLVSRTRRGRSVLYARTDAGQRLIEPG